MNRKVRIMMFKKIYYDFLIGFKSLQKKSIWIAVMLCYLTVISITFIERHTLLSYTSNDFLSSLIDVSCWTIYILALLSGTFIICSCCSYPYNNLSLNRVLRSCRLETLLNITPTLVDFSESSDKKEKLLTFDDEGIPISKWEEKKEFIESSLDIRIIDIFYTSGVRRLSIRFVPATDAIPCKVQWSDALIQKDKDAFPVVLGVSLTGEIYINLCLQNSILIGGSTGSGKTMLLKNLVYQTCNLGAMVTIIDLKGGIDFSKKYWKEHCTIITTKQEALASADNIIKVMNQRKILFLKEQVSDISTYNAYHRDSLAHVVLACDEIASLLDVKGLSKAEKDITVILTSKLSEVARLGRAFGVHLIIATQRPDATVIDGQIKNNIDCRICGRADQVLSKIILDTTEAATRIPKNSQGRFLLSDGQEFQGYWMNEDDAYG